MVSKLLKSLYGLKQEWYAKMHTFLVNDVGFKSSHNDPCLYLRHKNSSILLICLYVDDFLIARSNEAEISAIKGELSQPFEMKDLGSAKVILGIETKRDRPKQKLFIRQSEYIPTILKRFGTEHSRAVSTLMGKSKKKLST